MLEVTSKICAFSYHETVLGVPIYLILISDATKMTEFFDNCMFSPTFCPSLPNRRRLNQFSEIPKTHTLGSWNEIQDSYKILLSLKKEFAKMFANRCFAYRKTLSNHFDNKLSCKVSKTQQTLTWLYVIALKYNKGQTDTIGS